MEAPRKCRGRLERTSQNAAAAFSQLCGERAFVRGQEAKVELPIVGLARGDDLLDPGLGAAYAERSEDM